MGPYGGSGWMNDLRGDENSPLINFTCGHLLNFVFMCDFTKYRIRFNQMTGHKINGYIHIGTVLSRGCRAQKLFHFSQTIINSHIKIYIADEIWNTMFNFTIINHGWSLTFVTSWPWMSINLVRPLTVVGHQSLMARNHSQPLPPLGPPRRHTPQPPMVLQRRQRTPLPPRGLQGRSGLADHLTIINL